MLLFSAMLLIALFIYTCLLKYVTELGHYANCVYIVQYMTICQ